MAETALLAISALSAISGAAGQLMEGNQKASMLQLNQALTYQRARQIEQQSQAQAAIQRNQDERRLGSMRAAYGAAGVDPNQGTPLEVMSDAAAQGELERQMTLWGGRVRANDAITQGNIYGYQSGLEASNAAWKAGTTLLTGGLNAYVSSGIGDDAIKPISPGAAMEAYRKAPTSWTRAGLTF